MAATIDGRKVIYEERQVRECVGKDAMSVKHAKELLGWEDDDKSSWKGPDGKGFTCHNVMGTKQRPFTPALAKQWMGQILGRPGAPINPRTKLGGNWEITGDTIRVTKTGIVIQGQHRLIGLVWAGQFWKGHRDQYPGWKHEPALSTYLIQGLDEHRQVLYAMDIGKNWTFSDGLYAEGMFDDLEDKDRRKIVKVCEHAVRLLWERAGADTYAYSNYRSPIECLAFLERHPSLTECVKFIYSENEGVGSVGKLLPIGYASGMMYLMASSASDPKSYWDAVSASAKGSVPEDKLPNEDLLDNWDRMDGEEGQVSAQDFWIQVTRNEETNEVLRKAISESIEKSEGGFCLDERKAIIVKAWDRFVAGKPIDAEALKLSCTENEYGTPILDENPTVGGIDRGRPLEPDEEDTEEEEEDKTVEVAPKPTKKKTAKKAPTKKKAPKKTTKKAPKKKTAKAKPKPKAKPDPTPQEIKAGTEAIKQQNGKDLAEAPPKRKRKKTTKVLGQWKQGMKCWVRPKAGEEPYQGRISLLDPHGKKALVEILSGFQGAGNDSWLPISALLVDQPQAKPLSI